MDSFKVVDLVIKFLISWFWADGLPLFGFLVPKEELHLRAWLGSKGVRTTPVIVDFFGDMM
jgi:hypothetical protein